MLRAGSLYTYTRYGASACRRAAADATSAAAANTCIEADYIGRQLLQGSQPPGNPIEIFQTPGAVQDAQILCGDT